MVNSCIALVAQIMLNLVHRYFSMPFLIKIPNYFKNGFKLWKEKTGYQTNIALSVVTTLNHPVLLSDQEKLGADCELLLYPRDPHALKIIDYPMHAKFTCFKQKGGLILPSPAVLKMVKAAEVHFKKSSMAKMGTHLWKKHSSKDSVCCIETVWLWSFSWVFFPFLPTCNWGWKQPLEVFPETYHTKST